MSNPTHRPALAWPGLLATVLLLILLLGAYALIESRRLQQDLSRELTERAVALIDILEASSKNAITSNALLEEAVAQRLLDNARFIDFFVARSPLAHELIQRVVSENRLAKAELLDPEGNPISLSRIEAPPAPGGGGRGPRMMGRMMGPPPESEPRAPQGQRPPGMPFMWGHRWGGPGGDPSRLFPSLPTNAKIRRFWEGSAFGVAISAQSFSGIIAVHADAEYLLNFRREIGVQRLIEDLGRQAGVAGAALLDRDLTVLASSDASEVGRKEESAFLRAARQAGTTSGRRKSLGDGREVYEVVKPFALEKRQVGLVRLDLSTEGLAGVVRQTQRGVLFYSLGLLLVGILGAVAIFWVQARHLAERRALEAIVAQEQRLSAVGNLAAGVAHEVRNPLNAISIGLQRLRKEFAPAESPAREEYVRFTEIMQAEVGRLNAIVDQFLGLARPTRLILTEEPLAEILDELLTLLSSQASAQKIRVETGLTLGTARARMDRRAFTHAVMNVLLNAIQAMPDGGVLTVRAYQDPGGRRQKAEGSETRGRSVPPTADRRIPPGWPSVVIEVEDTGPGIPAQHRDRIFEPYFTTKQGGTGLGLAMAHKIVEEHGGAIRVESQAGSGATFIITLPLVDSA